MWKTISDIGEFGLIDRVAKKIKVDRSVIKGIGDDAAVIKSTRNKHLLLTTDMLVEDVHFTLKGATFPQIGWKSLAVNISDLAAMGGVPRYALVSVGLPRHLPLSAVDGICKGMQKLAKRFNINIVGGDTVRSKKLIINVALQGEVERKNLVLRSGAKVGDIIFVTGCLGGALVNRHLDFLPRLKESRFLVRHFRPTSMIDISDGLASDLRQISRSSGVGAVIYDELIPVSKQAKSLNGALFTGEDFELLFTIPLKEAKRLSALTSISVTRIGEIVDKRCGVNIIGRSGRARLLNPKGFKHF